LHYLCDTCTWICSFFRFMEQHPEMDFSQAKFSWSNALTSWCSMIYSYTISRTIRDFGNYILRQYHVWSSLYNISYAGHSICVINFTTNQRTRQILRQTLWNIKIYKENYVDYIGQVLFLSLYYESEEATCMILIRFFSWKKIVEVLSF
jgi:hypothetical protein